MKVIAVYDNGEKSLDRYTIVVNSIVSKNRNKYQYDAISATENGLGVFMWVQCERGKHLGKKIEFASLSKELQKKVELAIH
jgi:hypothetical protein